ncbi:sugar ABC transporter permease [Paenibacillus sedimenti]|uniref:Sugar ABC transporter permease n=1 Tax=Paenibacillus sedimenti TaxID=2770274 RepID=A0A926KRY2_9BACL|nr:sugar ABC transporter permease [Paenibacillus sedimenti]MBD0382036.1 sugar ABC transporter permease [Paenibacillus sedimenti]
MKKKQWVSVLLSFVLSGLGHLYLGLFLRGIIFIALILTSYFLSKIVSPIFSLVFIILWVIGMVDSARQTKRINMQQ